MEVPVHGRIVIACMLLLLVTTGCASTSYLTPRSEPFNPLAGTLDFVSKKGPQPSPRTLRLLRRYDLHEKYQSARLEALAGLQGEAGRNPSADKLHAIAELAYLEGLRHDRAGRLNEALEMYGAAVTHAYLYLFDQSFDNLRNPYDPHFRSACDLYNMSLEGAMRVVDRQGQLQVGRTVHLETDRQRFVVNVVARGSWSAEEFERLEFTTDYELGGLTNRHHSYGLGVPLIAVRRPGNPNDVREKYYPPGLSFPVTAFMRVVEEPQQGADGKTTLHCVLELHDPLVVQDIQVANRWVPLESDLTIPLAYFLDNPQFEERRNIATLALLDPSQADSIKGLFMLEPYDPEKIPVLMVHGLWSSPVTWMEMFNDLRSFPELRKRYQFWFYLYPTGQPFWISATQLRADLAKVRQEVDPHRESFALDQMVLVGHSMGGLVSRMQVLESGDDFWRILTERPFDELKATEEDRRQLAAALFFQPNPSVKRVVTLGTPHRGSEFANDYTRWLGRRLIRLPQFITNTTNRLIRDNPDFFHDTELLTISTSIDSLAPESPILPVMLRAPEAPWVVHHNIVGTVPEDGWIRRFSGHGDGIVSLASAQMERAASEITVPADHVSIHRHPRATLEVRRILLSHLREIDLQVTSRAPAQTARPEYHPATTGSSVEDPPPIPVPAADPALAP